MGRQVNFFMAPADHAEFIAMLAGVPDLRVLDDRSSCATPLLIAEFEKEMTGVYRPKVHLVRAPDLADVHLDEARPGDWRVDSLRSPVVEFSPSRTDDRSLRRGRLFFDAGFFADDGAWQQKSEVFTKWAEQRIEWVRRNLEYSKDRGAYVGRAAKALAESSDVALRSM